MKASEVYLRAAKIVDKRGVSLANFSCHAVHLAAGIPLGVTFEEKDCPLTIRYAKTMDILGKSLKTLWAGDPQELQKEVRVLALLFMHQIAKDAEASK